MAVNLLSAQFLIKGMLNNLLPKGSELSNFMRYSSIPPGKCVRGYLVMKSANAFGAHGDSVVQVAAAVELIHTYSLIHDDLPALDNDSVRRGRQSCHVKFGEANAILAGNALLTLAFGILGEKSPSAVPVVAKFINLMIEGQVFDLNSSKRVENLLEIYRMKTGALFAMAAVLGVFLANKQNLHNLQIMENYGNNIGVAFQIIDDINDENEGVEIAKHKKILAEFIRSSKECAYSLGKEGEYFMDFTDEILVLV